MAHFDMPQAWHLGQMARGRIRGALSLQVIHGPAARVFVRGERRGTAIKEQAASMRPRLILELSLTPVQSRFLMDTTVALSPVHFRESSRLLLSPVDFCNSHPSNVCSFAQEALRGYSGAKWC